MKFPMGPKDPKASRGGAPPRNPGKVRSFPEESVAAEQGAAAIARGTVRTAGRAWHLVDIENLGGGGNLTYEQLCPLFERYRQVACYTPGDHVYIGCDAHLVTEVSRAWSGPRICAGRGRDGADRALLATAPPDFVASRFSRVVVGSGDGIFGTLVTALLERGVHVEVVALPGALSRRLGEKVACYPFPRLQAAKPAPHGSVASSPAG